MHIGKLPVKVLQHNLTKVFEDVSGLDVLKREITEGVLDRYLNYAIGGNRIEAPFAKDNVIQVSENYLGFLWAYIYGSWVQFEEGIMKPEMREMGDVVELKPIVLEGSKLILEWALRQRGGVSNWPSNIPNPEVYNNDEEKYYGEKVNAIFIKAMVILLFHEKAHIIHRHANYLDIKDEEWKELEKEADNYGFEKLMEYKNSCSDSDVLENGIAALMVFSSNLFLVQSPECINQKRHPNLDERLFNFIEKSNIKAEKHQYYLYKFASTIVRHYYYNNREYFKIKGVEPYSIQVETARDLFIADMEIFTKA